ncbi:MAG: MFS transporter [Alistipes sp.]|nr:MFS transporter [Alistipes senegalensis]MCM1251075.1 MFS transporter [Alistipes sp.]
MPRRLGAILAVAFGVGLSVLDSAIANVALPTLGREFSVSAADSVWIVNAYQLAVMATILPFAAWGESIGYRKIYLGGLALFTSASAGCALAGSLGTLVLARALQGVGAAAVTSINTTLIRFIYPRAQLGRGMGINATVVAVSSVAGPALAAGILSVGEWPWLFAINIPVGIVALWLSARFLPRNPVQRDGHRPRRCDMAMNALTFGLLMASVEGYSHGWDGRLIAGGVAAMLVVGFFFVRSQLREPRPLLPLDLLRIPIFSVSMLTSVCSYLAQMLSMVALPFYLQHTFRFDEVAAGVLLTAWPAVIVVVAPVAGMLVGRVHAGALGGMGLATMAVGLTALAWLPDRPGTFDIVWRLMLGGAGFALFQSPNNSLLIASAPPERSGSASGMLATARLIGQTSGAALMALLFHVVPDHSARTALCVAGAGAAVGAVVSFCRLSLPLPESLMRRR